MNGRIINTVDQSLVGIMKIITIESQSKFKKIKILNKIKLVDFFILSPFL